MSKFGKSCLVVSALIGATWIGAASAAETKGFTKMQADKLNECIAMPQATRERDAGCMAMMGKANISFPDFEKLHACGPDTKTGACATLAKRRDDALKG